MLSKKNQILSIQENSLICSSSDYKLRWNKSPRVQVVKGFQWGHVKEKPCKKVHAHSEIFSHIKRYSDIFKLNQIYSGIIQELFRHIHNPVYLRYIQNPVKNLRRSFLRKFNQFLWKLISFAISAFQVLTTLWYKYQELF